jgi:hypothetical protein
LTVGRIKRLLDQVIGLSQHCTVVPLRGNHEKMLLAALEGKSELRYWLKFGGTEALGSYGYSGFPHRRIAATLFPFTSPPDGLKAAQRFQGAAIEVGRNRLWRIC